MVLFVLSAGDVDLADEMLKSITDESVAVIELKAKRFERPVT